MYFLNSVIQIFTHVGGTIYLKEKNMKTTTILLSIILFQCHLMLAQDDYHQNIRGIVTDKEMGIALPGATVVLLGSAQPEGTITGADGYFNLENVPVGRQGIRISYVGYQDVTVNNFMLSAGKEAFLEIEMEEKITEVDEVVIRAYNRKDKAINDMAMVSARSFSVEETERFAGSLGDPARMVANYAGVMTQNDSRNDIIIRGNSPLGLLWRLDGIEIPNPNHFGALGTTGGPISILNNNLLTNSDFYTGAFPSEFSNALAGAFDLNVRSGNNQKKEYVGQVGFNGFEVGAEGPFSDQSNATYLANYRYSTLAVFDAVGFDMGTGAAIPQYQDLTFKLDFPGTRLGKFALLGIGGKSYIELGRGDSISNSYNAAGTITDFGAELGVLALNHLYFFNENTRVRTILTAQGSRSFTRLDSIKNNASEATPFVRNDYREGKYSLSSKLKSKINSKNTLSIGFIYDYYDLNYKDSIREENGLYDVRLNSENDLHLFRTYGEWKHRFNNDMSAYAGLNVQHLFLNKETTFEPRLGLKWQFTDRMSVYTGAGLHSQVQPKMAYFYESENASGMLERTNSNLKMSKSIHYVAGYDWLMNRNFRCKAEIYYQYLYDIPVQKDWPEFSMLNAGDFFGLPLLDSLVNRGTGENYGVEFTIEKFLSQGYYFLITTSLFDSKYVGYDDVKRSTAYDGEFVVNVLAGYEFKIKSRNFITLDLRTVWAGGKRYTPVDIAGSVEENAVVWDWERPFEMQEDYFRVDFRIGYKMNGRRISQEWAVDLQNLTAHQNLFMEEFNFEEGKVNKVYQQGFVPMMLYRIQF